MFFENEPEFFEDGTADFLNFIVFFWAEIPAH